MKLPWQCFKLSYDQLYREALTDPELKRTREELEAAMSNAREARKVVFELFQDLDGFSLDDYKPLADIDDSKARIIDFISSAVEGDGGGFRKIDKHRFELSVNSNSSPIICTLDRDLAQEDDSLVLIGIDHPITDRLSKYWRDALPSVLGATATIGLDQPTVLSVWLVQSFGSGPDKGTHMVPIAVDQDGNRVPSLEKRYRECFRAPAGKGLFDLSDRTNLLHQHIEPTLQRELNYRDISSPERGYSTELLTWIEVS